MLAAAGLVAIVVALALAGARDDRSGVAQPPVPTGTPTATPTPTPCVDTELGKAIGGTKAGRYMAVSLDRVTLEGDQAQWHVRWFIGPGADRQPGNATIGLDAIVTGPNGDVPVRSYASGPPNGPFTPASGPVTVVPCRSVVVLLTTDAVQSGDHHVLFREVTLPEGGEPVDVPIAAMHMECDENECVNTAGTGGECCPPQPTSSPGNVAPPSEGMAVISGRPSYPAGFLPDLEIYAIDVNDPSRWFHVHYEGIDRPPPPDELPAYRLEVEPGTYWVIQYAGEQGDSAGLYSKAVTCGLLASCTDHTLIEVTVREGDLITGIDPGDWYYPPEHEYPDRPR